MIEAFCTTCQKVAYVREGDAMFCPVCSSPLIEVTPAPRSETG